MKSKLLLTLSFLLLFSSAVALTQHKIATLEQNIFKQVNEHRKENKKSLLKHDPLISGVCRKHAEAMAKGTIPFSHDDIRSRFNEIQKVVPKVISGAENLAWNKGYPDPDSTAVRGWIDSPSHHEAMLGDYVLTGIGGARSEDDRYYFNQIFVKCRKSKFKSK